MMCGREKISVCYWSHQTFADCMCFAVFPPVESKTDRFGRTNVRLVPVFGKLGEAVCADGWGKLWRVMMEWQANMAVRLGPIRNKRAIKCIVEQEQGKCNYEGLVCSQRRSNKKTQSPPWDEFLTVPFPWLQPLPLCSPRPQVSLTSYAFEGGHWDRWADTSHKLSGWRYMLEIAQ